MKKNFIPIICFFTINFLVDSIKSQSLKVIYTASAISKFSEQNSDNISSNNFLAFEELMMKSSVNFILKANGNKSVYHIQKELNQNNNPQYEIIKILFGSLDLFFVDYINDEFINQKNAYGEYFLLPLEKLTWEFSDETKKIGDYLCFKAVTHYTTSNGGGKFKKKVIAWYAPTIENEFGPRGYFGLPGLILELRDHNLLFTATEISIATQEIFELSKPTKGKEISIEKFENLRPSLDFKGGK